MHSYALAEKEPNRDDFEAGAANQPKAELLNDLEIGVEKRENYSFRSKYLLHAYIITNWY